MRYFALLDLQYVVLLVALGFAVLLLLCLAFGSYRERPEEPEEMEEYAEGIQVANRPIPPILLFVYVSFVLWALGYLIAIGIRGGSF